MNLLTRIFNAILAGVMFFIAQILITLIFAYIIFSLKRVPFDFSFALCVGVKFGLYVGAVSIVLAFWGAPGPRFRK